MALPIFIGIAYAWFMRTVVSWIAQRIMWMVITSVATWLFVYVTKDLLVAITNKAADAIRTSNSGIMARFFKIEDMIWRAYDYFFSMIDKGLAFLESKLNTIMDAINIEQFESYLITLNFAAWLDGLVAEIITATADTIRAALEVVAAPLLILSEGISAKLTSLQETVTDIETVFNAKLDTLFSSIAEMYDVFDQAITDISILVAGLKQDVDTHNTAINNGHTGLSLYLEQRLDEMTGMTSGEAVIFVNELRAFTDTAFTTQDTTAYDIDWTQYRWINPHDRTDYLLSIDLPLIAELITDQQAIRTSLDTFPADIQAKFQDLFPSILRGNLEDRIKAFLLIGMTRALIEKKVEVQESITSMRETYKEDVTTRKEDLILEVEALKQEIKDFEVTIIEKLPEAFRSPLEKAVDEIAEAIATAGEEAVVNIDQLIPDVEEIDHIVEIFPADLKANLEPNNTDSVDFTIQDIYRLLCNNFYRSERIALIMMLTPQDLKLDTSELKDWLEKLREENV